VAIPKEMLILSLETLGNVVGFTTLCPEGQRERLTEHFFMLGYIPSFSPGGSHSRKAMFFGLR